MRRKQIGLLPKYHVHYFISMQKKVEHNPALVPILKREQKLLFESMIPREINNWLLFYRIFLILLSILISYILKEERDVKTVEAVLEEVKMNDITIPQNSYIYDKNGELISTIKKDVNRQYINYEEIPDKVIEAFIYRRSTFL
ncbi:hypothetical protein ACE1TI_21295 [Alteribacillus sp. JSM 102045]|uniref:hypothetical protein n=1 Tax=Alteribacillus sp. JSM 102045 TaxID=1562101 RepID=UPI0035C118C4